MYDIYINIIKHYAYLLIMLW